MSGTQDFTPFLDRAAEGIPFSADEMQAAMDLLLGGTVDPVQAGAFLAVLKVRGEVLDEILGAARAMRRAAVGFEGPADAIDTCGTGGTGLDTVNISTATAVVLASSGVPVAKHGNRSATSKTGAADVLTALGFDTSVGIAQSKASLEKVGLTFLFAPNHHPAMRHVAPVRRALKIRTLFNLLGPLTNPAGARRQLLGVYDSSLVVPIAEALNSLGSERAWVVHGDDGLDELTVCGESLVAELKDGVITERRIKPEDATLDRHPPDALRGGPPAENAAAMRRLLDGEAGAYRDAVVLNAAAGLIVAGKSDNLAKAARLAEAEIDSGRAKARLARFLAFNGTSSP